MCFTYSKKKNDYSYPKEHIRGFQRKIKAFLIVLNVID